MYDRDGSLAEAALRPHSLGKNDLLKNMQSTWSGESSGVGSDEEWRLPFDWVSQRSGQQSVEASGDPAVFLLVLVAHFHTSFKNPTSPISSPIPSPSIAPHCLANSIDIR